MKKVLVIDDAAFMRMSIMNILKKNGYTIVGEAGNGLEGLKKYMELSPDIVTLDIIMPEMDGLDTLSAIKKVNKDAKVVMVSAMGQEGYVRQAVANGAKGFIVKPFKEDHVIKTLSAL